MEAKGATRLLEVATAAARLAAKLGSDLGLDPIGHAKIRALGAGADASAAAADLASLSAAGKAARLAAGENGGDRAD
jgi:phage terminase small subunit